MDETGRVAAFRFDPAPLYRVFGEVGALLALSVVKNPRKRWRLQYRVQRIRRRRGVL